MQVRLELDSMEMIWKEGGVGCLPGEGLERQGANLLVRQALGILGQNRHHHLLERVLPARE